MKMKPLEQLASVFRPTRDYDMSLFINFLIEMHFVEDDSDDPETRAHKKKVNKLINFILSKPAVEEVRTFIVMDRIPLSEGMLSYVPRFLTPALIDLIYPFIVEEQEMEPVLEIMVSSSFSQPFFDYLVERFPELVRQCCEFDLNFSPKWRRALKMYSSSNQPPALLYLMNRSLTDPFVLEDFTALTENVTEIVEMFLGINGSSLVELDILDQIQQSGLCTNE